MIWNCWCDMSWNSYRHHGIWISHPQKQCGTHQTSKPTVLDLGRKCRKKNIIKGGLQIVLSSCSFNLWKFSSRSASSPPKWTEWPIKTGPPCGMIFHLIPLSLPWSLQFWGKAPASFGRKKHAEKDMWKKNFRLRCYTICMFIAC